MRRKAKKNAAKRKPARAKRLLATAMASRVLIPVIPDLDQAGGLQSLDGIAHRRVLSNGVPLFGVMQRKPKRCGHVLTETNSPALIVL